LLLQLAASSIFMLVLGLLVFRKLKDKFYDYL
jgi:ABC-type polysaccharide/polyol phosphate export permease